MTEQVETGSRLSRPDGAPPLYAQDGKGLDAIVHAHYFIGGCDWLVTEYDPDEEIAFGWACLNGDRQNSELGYTSLRELEEIRVPLRVEIQGRGVQIGEQLVERDLDWPEGRTITESIDYLDQIHGRKL